MDYQREIFLILHEANPKEGLPLGKIVRNVYNMTCTDLFSRRSYDDVYDDVRKYLRRESSRATGSVRKAEKRGWYCSNPDSVAYEQLKLEFEPENEIDLSCLI